MRVPAATDCKSDRGSATDRATSRLSLARVLSRLRLGEKRYFEVKKLFLE
jgi:hypothetical protein